MTGFLGIDPGLSGGIATRHRISDNEYRAAFGLPPATKGAAA